MRKILTLTLALLFTFAFANAQELSRKKRKAMVREYKMELKKDTSYCKYQIVSDKEYLEGRRGHKDIKRRKGQKGHMNMRNQAHRGQMNMKNESRRGQRMDRSRRIYRPVNDSIRTQMINREFEKFNKRDTVKRDHRRYREDEQPIENWMFD